MLNIFNQGSTVTRLSQQVAEEQNIQEEAALFLDLLQQGKFDATLSETLTSTRISGSLEAMRGHLKQFVQEETERNWLNTGLAKFGDILRNKDALNLKDLSDLILSTLVKYVSANQGAIFTVEDEPGDIHLRMIACYAYDRKKYLEKRIEIGDGLAGQCVLERDAIYIKQVPASYVSITSGLGEATPRNVFICPLLVNETIFGVLELASFDEMVAYKIDFIKKLGENIAASIRTVKENERVLTLLRSSQEQTEMLRSQEEEMRQNMEELQATQEEMERKTKEMNRSTAGINSTLRGINATMATIEFSPEGVILDANENFLKTMRCTMSEIKGKHHKMFVPADIVNADDYQSFWSRLASGQPLSGVFKRVRRDGKLVWLNAIYNPVENEEGVIIKVVKLANDITTQQESIAKTAGLLNGINATMATIEFTPDGYILDANENFTKVMKCSVDEIRGTHHRRFVPSEMANDNGYIQFWKSLADGHANAGTFRRKAAGGDTVWLNAIYNPVRDANGDVVKVVKFATDVTEQQELTARTHGLMKGIHATMAVIEFSPEGIVLEANENFLQAMGYSIHEVRGKHHSIFVPEEIFRTPEYQVFWPNLSAGDPVTGTFKRKTSKGSPIWLYAIYNPVKNANGEVIRVVKFATVTKSEATEQGQATLREQVQIL